VLTPVLVYAAGVAVGLWRVDGSPAARLVVALLWPLALAAAVVTISALVVAAMVLFPAVGAAVVGLGGLTWWVLG
jgi:hypothetical protein